MLIYILVFFIILILSVLIEKSNNKKRQVTLCILIVLVLSFLGGLRGNTIGTDLQVYGESWFVAAHNYKSFDAYKESRESDNGYLALNYIVAQFSTKLNMFLFVLQLICNGLVLNTLFKYKDKMSFTVAVLFYYLGYYFRNYNLLRQTLALAILFYAIRYLFDKKYIKFSIFILIAGQFHFTAYFAFIMLLIHVLSTSKIKYKEVIMFLTISIAFLGLFYINEILTVLYNARIINDRIFNYTTRYAKAEVDINFTEAMMRLYFIVIASYYTVVKKEKKENASPLFAFILLDFISIQMSTAIRFADRIAFYFGYTKMLYVPFTIKEISKNKKTEWTLNIITVGVLIMFWYFKYISHGYGQIYPYQFGDGLI